MVAVPAAQAARTGRLRTWFLIHRWSSLACTVFLLLLCLTGLPLIFADEIDDWTADDPPYAALPPDAPRASLDRILEEALRRYPGEIPRFLSIDDDEPKVVITLAPSPDAERRLNHWLRFDARTGEVIKDIPAAALNGTNFMRVMLRLHIDLFAALPGNLFLGLMGLLFVLAVVSGAVLYGPYMRKLEFGTVRRGRTRRLAWLDLHNLLGVVTLAWAVAVGTTGAINELTGPLFNLWRATELTAMLQPYRGQPLPARLASVEDARATVEAALPGRTIVTVVYPSAEFGSPHHYLFWAQGNTPLTSRLLTPALVDARTGQLTAAPGLPWYLRVLELSRPLHFGDYGGLPLKVIWALLDLVTILVLASGLYLFVARPRRGAE